MKETRRSKKQRPIVELFNYDLEWSQTLLKACYLYHSDLIFASLQVLNLRCGKGNKEQKSSSSPSWTGARALNEQIGASREVGEKKWDLPQQWMEHIHIPSYIKQATFKPENY